MTARTPEDLIAQGYRVNVLTYVGQGWQSFINKPLGYLSFVWGCLLATLAAEFFLVFAAQSTHNAFLSGLSQWAVYLLHPGAVLLIIAGTATATWFEIQGVSLPFWGVFTSPIIVRRLVLCGVVAALLLQIYGVAIVWIVRLVGNLFNLNTATLDVAAPIIGALVAFLYPGVNWTLAPFLILDRNLTAWAAILVSWNVIAEGWWGMLALSLIFLLPVMLLWTVIFLLPIYPPVQGLLLLLSLGPFIALLGSSFSIAYADIFGLESKTLISARHAPRNGS